MKDFHSMREKGEVNAPDYYEKKRETVLEAIAPICEAFEITDYDYEIAYCNERVAKETLIVEDTRLACTLNSIVATVRILVKHILSRI